MRTDSRFDRQALQHLTDVNKIDKIVGESELSHRMFDDASVALDRTALSVFHLRTVNRPIICVQQYVTQCVFARQGLKAEFAAEPRLDLHVRRERFVAVPHCPVVDVYIRK